MLRRDSPEINRADRSFWHRSVRTLAVVAALALIACAPAGAQVSDFERWLERRAQELASFTSARDSAFAEMLGREWVDFDVESRMRSTPGAPKPVSPTIFRPDPDGGLSVPGSADAAAAPESNPPEKVSADPKDSGIAEAPAPGDAVPGPKAAGVISEPLEEESGVSLLFLGQETVLPILDMDAPTLPGTIDEASISQAWATWALRDTSDRPLWRMVSDQCEAWMLPDWGCVVLAQDAGTALGGSALANEANVFAWYVLTKMEWAVRVGYAGTEVYLLVASDDPIYGMTSVILDDFQYFLVPPPGGNDPGQVSLRTYPSEEEVQNRLIRISIESMDFGMTRTARRSFEYTDEGATVAFDLDYNLGAVELLDRLPQVRPEVLMNAPLSSDLTEGLRRVFTPMFRNMPDLQKLNRLLRFVQVGFDYQVDDDQFGQERYLWPEEVLHFPAADCEDRVFLLAALVREFIGREVIALRYPGHLAMAVAWESGSAIGDHIVWDGKTFLVADPTYIGAPAGVSMPQFADVSPTVVVPNGRPLS
ncbi:hypothetical protein OAJ07_03125 [Gemmatimonadales bacterium]|nr:hypothetical protein [Gemmatimonadales bacterium]